MSLYISQKLIRHRTLIVAVGNAAITWVILIIAPLGLFAVIVCTLAVFAGSYTLGNLCDRALLGLLKEREQRSANAVGTTENFTVERASDRHLDIQASLLDPNQSKRFFDPDASAKDEQGNI